MDQVDATDKTRRFPPLYMADGITADPGFGFTREVEWDANRSQIIVTDSGCENSQVECLREGRILSVQMPELEEAGTSGAFTDDHDAAVAVRER